MRAALRGRQPGARQLLHDLGQVADRDLALAIARHLGAAPAVVVAEVAGLPGRGLRARWAGRLLAIGPAPDGCGHQVTLDVLPVARLLVVDGLRPDAALLMAMLRRRGIAPRIASGDAAAAVAATAAALGIVEAGAGLLPEDKAALVGVAAGHGPALMLGDGVNDAAALAAARAAGGVAVAVRGGLVAAQADVVVGDEAAPLAAVAALFTAADRLARRERGLLWLTVGYNALAVGAAVGGLWGPLVCAVGMPLSSLAALALAVGWRPFAPIATVGRG